MATSIYLNQSTKFQASAGRYALTPTALVNVDPDTPENNPMLIILDGEFGDGDFLDLAVDNKNVFLQSGIYSICCNIPVGFGTIGTIPEIEFRVQITRASGGSEIVCTYETRLSNGRTDHVLSFPAYTGYCAKGDKLGLYALNGTPVQLSIGPSESFMNVSKIY